MVIVLPLKQLHYHVCLWLLLFYFWFAQTFLSEKEKRKEEECKGVLEEQPSVVLIRMAEPMT